MSSTAVQYELALPGILDDVRIVLGPVRMTVKGYVTPWYIVLLNGGVSSCYCQPPPREKGHPTQGQPPNS
ncbi:MAG: hypothetical protein WBB22_05120 [Anaerolineae bacterium]